MFYKNDIVKIACKFDEAHRQYHWTVVKTSYLNTVHFIVDISMDNRGHRVYILNDIGYGHNHFYEESLILIDNSNGRQLLFGFMK